MENRIAIRIDSQGYAVFSYRPTAEASGNPAVLRRPETGGQRKIAMVVEYGKRFPAFWAAVIGVILIIPTIIGMKPLF
jgi:hypothetical protein